MCFGFGGVFFFKFDCINFCFFLMEILDEWNIIWVDLGVGVVFYIISNMVSGSFVMLLFFVELIKLLW